MPLKGLAIIILYYPHSGMCLNRHGAQEYDSGYPVTGHSTSLRKYFVHNDEKNDIR